MSRWFRFYGEALNDHKVQSLTPDLFKTWVNLLCTASLNDGVLPTAERLAFELRVSSHEMQSRLDELVLLGLLDIRTDKKLEPHNWQERQFLSDASADRTRKYRERLKKKGCDVTVTANVTPPESYTDTDTDIVSSLSHKPSLKKKQGFNFVSNEGKTEEEPETLKRNAEGLGLDVGAICRQVDERRPRNRSAYFTKLCVSELQNKLPRGTNEGLIRDALWGKGRAIGDLYALLMGAA